MAHPRNTLDRAWSRVAIGTFDECWPFIGAPNTYGYGQMRLDGKHELVHRLVFRLCSGYDPGALQVLHSCDNRRCCNPLHLFIGTNLDNCRDAVAKRRHVHGERHPQAKLNAVQVGEIRRLFERGQRFAAIGRRFGVTAENVSYICRRETWRFV